MSRRHLVPLRGAGRVVADRDLKAGLLGQAGELFFQARTR